MTKKYKFPTWNMYVKWIFYSNLNRNHILAYCCGKSKQIIKKGALKARPGNVLL